jgi:hypothetical protein
VATKRGTSESVCAELVGTSEAEPIRTYFNERLRVEDLPDRARRVNGALGAEIAERVGRRACEIALDLHERPY